MQNFYQVGGETMLKRGVIFTLLMCKVIFASIDEYRLFDVGKEEFKKKNYYAAEKIFSAFSDTYSNTTLMKSNYPNYYIGLNYYKLENYTKAIQYFEKADYVPLEYKLRKGYFKGKKSDNFEYERIFYTAQSYFTLNQKDKAKAEYLKLYRNYYDYELIDYEKKSLTKLAEIDKYYENIYEIKFKNDYSKLDKLTEEDLLKIADYVYSRGNFVKSSEIYRVYLENKDDPWTEIKVLKALFRAKKHDSVIKLANEYLETNPYKSYVYYYLGNSTRRKGDIDNAIKYFKKVKVGSHVKEAEYLIGRLYFISKDYRSAEEWLKKSTWMAAKKMQLSMYLAEKDQKKYEKETINLILKYPYSDEAAFYRYKLYEMTGRRYLDMILLHNPNTLYYEKALQIKNKNVSYKKFKADNYETKYNDKLRKISELNKFKDKNYAKIELSNINFKEDDKIFEKYITAKIFADNELYNEAIRTALSDGYNFSKYSELNKLLYPKYYQESVKKYAKLYGVEEELVYSIIKQESLFESNVISRAAAYGLMQIIMPTAKTLDENVTEAMLLNPDENIRLGTKYLSQLDKMFKGNISHIAAGYNGGPGNAKKWPKDKNGDLIIEKIPFAETKKYVEKVLNNYYKYKRIYND